MGAKDLVKVLEYPRQEFVREVVDRGSRKTTAASCCCTALLHHDGHLVLTR
jgi:hypothetical protein